MSDFGKNLIAAMQEAGLAEHIKSKQAQNRLHLDALQSISAAGDIGKTLGELDQQRIAPPGVAARQRRRLVGDLVVAEGMALPGCHWVPIVAPPGLSHPSPLGRTPPLHRCRPSNR